MAIDTPPPYRTTLLLDDDGDLFFDGGGKIVMTEYDDDKRGQDVAMYLKTVIGEDVFDRNMGLDIISVKESPFNPARIEYEIRVAIEQYRARYDRPNRIKEISSIIVGDPDENRVVRVDINLISDTNQISTLGINV